MNCLVWILGDQLLRNHPALVAAKEKYTNDEIGVVLIESNGRLKKHPYQRKKLVLLFSAMRHYGEELKSEGVTVLYKESDTFTQALIHQLDTQKPEAFFVMETADYDGRQYQQQSLPALLPDGCELTLLPNTQFLIGQFNPYPDRKSDKKVIMEYFYREMRRHFGILMDDEEPAGGEWNFDKENRKPLPDEIELPEIKGFEPDDVTTAVMQKIEALPDHVGTVEGFNYAVTRQQAEAAFDQFMAERLTQFGPYEDAMTQRDATLFHSVISPYLNIGLLEPLPLIMAAEKAYREGNAPINSVEGFVRQILGWREYMYWQYWRQMPEMIEENAWQMERPVPQFFWDGDTQMNCLSSAIRRAIETGYTHHIERLMLLSNFSVLAGLRPIEVNNWFLTFYIDAYEWVMVPNVIGMGLNADGGKTATKPYISSANYINKMSDYCKGCAYHHTKRHGEDACPFNYLYWNFLLEHEEKLRANPRLGRNVLGLRHLDEDERTAVRKQAKAFLDSLEPYQP